MNYIRLKKEIPFSKKLNEWIKDRASSIKYKAIRGLKEVSFDQFKENTRLNGGTMHISSDFCENTIFGDPEINVMFRAWHDEVHLKLNEGFDYMAEARVAFAQISELPEDWREEKLLILSEVIGQAAYHEKTGEFVDNQRDFTFNLLSEGII